MNKNQLDEIESSVQALAHVWDQSAVVLDLIHKARHADKDLQSVERENMHMVAITGAVKSGKTWLIGKLLNTQTGPSGMNVQDATDHITYYIPEGRSISDEFEGERVYVPKQNWPTGIPAVCFVDVPGFDTIQKERKRQAEEILNRSTLKILVVAHERLRSETSGEYFKTSGCGAIQPVINMINGEIPAEDLQAFTDRFDVNTSSAEVFDPIKIPDFDLRGQDSSYRSVDDCVSEVWTKLTDYLNSVEPREEVDKQRRNYYNALCDQIRPLLLNSFQKLNDTYEEILEQEKDLLENLSEMLGPDELVNTFIRQNIRAGLLQSNNPVFFPWKTTGVMLHYAWGALDRLLLSVCGSLPSLVGTIMTAIQNKRMTGKVSGELESALKLRTDHYLEDKIRPKLCSLQEEFTKQRQPTKSILGRSQKPDVEVSINGLDHLQDKTMSIFIDISKNPVEKTLRNWRVVSILGMILFWLLFLPPLMGLYVEYLPIVKNFFTLNPATMSDFTFLQLGTLISTLIFCLFTLCLWQLPCFVVFTRETVVKKHRVTVNSKHENNIKQLRLSNKLYLDFKCNDELKNCLKLFSILQNHKR